MTEVVLVVTNTKEDWEGFGSSVTLVAWTISDDHWIRIDATDDAKAAVSRGANLLLARPDIAEEYRRQGHSGYFAWHRGDSAPTTDPRVTAFSHLSPSADDPVWNLVQPILAALSPNDRGDAFPFECWRRLRLCLNRTEEDARNAAIKALFAAWSKARGVEPEAEPEEYLRTIAAALAGAGLHFADLEDNFRPDLFDLEAVVRLRNCLFGDDQGSVPGRIPALWAKLHGPNTASS